MTPQDLIAALRGPEAPLFGVPPQHLQQMAGDVVRPPLSMFAPNVNQYNLSDFYDHITAPAGFMPPQNVNPVAHGTMTGKIRVIDPRNK